MGIHQFARVGICIPDAENTPLFLVFEEVALRRRVGEPLG
jgi:hypothetical protein